MKIIFKKVSPTDHELTIFRSDGSMDSKLLETKAFMPHDLIHLAYESTAGLKHSFWGKLALGSILDDLDVMENGFPDQTVDELALTEMITGVLTGFLKSGDMSYDDFLKILKNMLDAREIIIPEYISENFLQNFKEKFRKLLGQWNAMKKDEEMVVVWNHDHDELSPRT